MLIENDFSDLCVMRCVEGQTASDKNGCGFIIFDDKKLVDPGHGVYIWGAVIAHEVQHLVDNMADVATGDRISIMDTEVNAYTVQAYFDQAVQYTELSGLGQLWTYGGGINYSVIQIRASYSAKVDVSR